MKKIFHLLNLLALLCFSIHTYAYSNNTKLLSSKIEVSPGIQGSFIENNESSHFITNGSSRAYAQASAIYGRKMENVRINGSHGFIIENRSGHMQQYVIEYRLILSNGGFIRKSDTILISNNAVEKGSAFSLINQYFPTSGTFPYSVETTIRGEHSDFKNDHSYIQIS